MGISRSASRLAEKHGWTSLREWARIAETNGAQAIVDHHADVLKKRMTLKQAEEAVAAGNEILKHDEEMRRTAEIRRKREEERLNNKREGQKRRIALRIEERAQFKEMATAMKEHKLILADIFVNIHTLYESAWEYVDEYQTELMADPAYAIGSSDDLFTAGAKISLAGRVMASWPWEATDLDTAALIVEKLREQMMELVLHRCKYIPSSSSRSSNCAEMEEARVASLIVETIHWNRHQLTRLLEERAKQEKANG